MRKNLFLIALLGLFSTLAQAQVIWLGPVTHTSGTASYAGDQIPTHNITLTRTSSAGLSPIPQTLCGTGPYVIGGYAREDINFHFDKYATHVKLNFTDIQSNDEIAFYINGAAVNIKAANLFDNPLCTPVGPHTGVAMPSGHLTSTASPFGTTGTVQVVIDAAPALIQDFKVEHTHANPSAGGVVFSFEFADDSCKQELIATADTPCSGRILHLHATPFPNTTFAWEWTPPGGTTPTWTATGANPTRPNINVTQTGNYIVTATRGACTYKDTAVVYVKNSPAKPIITWPNPIPAFCKGDTVRIKGTTPSGGIGGVTHLWFDKNWNPAPKVQDTLIIEDVQPIHEGTYKEYAVSTDGCVSDTMSWSLVLNPDVTANFTFDQKEGCAGDTFVITNTSTGENSVNWFFSPRTGALIPVGTDNSRPGWTYVHPYDNSNPNPELYKISLAAYNGCKDTLELPVVIFHPLIDSFTVSKDTICQGATTIDFTNETSLPVPGKAHVYYWIPGDGSDTVQGENISYLYNNAGIFDASLYVVDYLGCIDSYKHTILVDSTGAIDFVVSDTAVCLGKTILFDGQFSRLGSLTAGWDFGDGNKIADTPRAVYTYENPGTYNVTFTLFNRICKDTIKKKLITVKPYPVIDLGGDTAMCPNGAPIAISERLNQGNNKVKYLWNKSTQDTTASILARHPGVYSLTATLNGCSTTDSILVAKNCYVDIPNAFTPDGDGNNDYFLPRQFMSRGIQQYTMTIFDRWGKKIFETNSSNGRGWDGKFNGEPQPNGVYIYLIDVTFVNSTNERYQGNVTLLR